MRIIGVTMAGNEADVIEAFVRHNLGLLDALVVLDHASVDATPHILASLVREGLPLVVLRDAERAFRQDVRQTQLARRYLGEREADFCFALDADEFIKAGSRAELERALGGIPDGHAAGIAIQNYVGAGARVGDPNPVRRLSRRMAVERRPSHKVVLPRGFATDHELHVSLGNHAVVRVRGGRAEPVAHARVPKVFLAHFPVRSPEQIARKALLGWLAHRLAVPGAGAGLMSHWKGIYAGLASGALPVDEALARRAVALYVGARAEGGPEEVDELELVEDPLPVPYELRYTHPAAVTPLALLAAWTDQLVTDIKAGATRFTA